MYIKISDNTYPVSLQEIKNSNLDRVFPKTPDSEALNSVGYAEVVEQAKPNYNADTHKLIEGTPINNAGTYEQVWQLQALDAGELSTLKDREILVKMKEINTDFATEADADVTSNSIVWNGGYDSATKLNNKAEALIFHGDANGVIYDKSNTARTLTPQEIKQIAYDISVAWEVAFAKLQTAKNAITSAGDNLSAIRAVTY